MQMIDTGQTQPFRHHAEADAVVLLTCVSAVTSAMHVHDHVVLACPVSHALDRAPSDDQIQHDHDRAQFLSEFCTLIDIFHGRAGDVQVGAFHLAGRGTGFVDAIHDVEKAVTPVHEGLRVDVLVVLHEVQTALQSFVNHAAIVAARQSQLRLGGGAQQGAAKLVEALALGDQAAGRTLEGFHQRHRHADVFQARGFQGLEAKDVSDEARRDIGDRAFFKQDDVVGDPAKVLPGSVWDRLDLVCLGAIAVASRQAIGPDDRPRRGA
ncbi:MAG: hypothetical protein BWZ07_01427 [Alphaproteobacteria bacterium ADurb.BinA280]|nr:MAG: hypothetical protein BWZ07_01427 [Alphaproteobacteria bacterium ADurb.BinA280]